LHVKTIKIQIDNGNITVVPIETIDDAFDVLKTYLKKWYATHLWTSTSPELHKPNPVITRVQDHMDTRDTTSQISEDIKQWVVKTLFMRPLQYVP
jgi:hypothetical protein